MKKTFCDRCGEEVPFSGNVQRFTIFDINKSVDLCDKCYMQFVRWILKDDTTKSQVSETD